MSLQSAKSFQIFSTLRNKQRFFFASSQHHDPGTTLTQAQHALARQYGFASWPEAEGTRRITARSAEYFTGSSWARAA